MRPIIAVSVDTVVRERARLTRGLSDLGWNVPPSGANFVFAQPPSWTTAAHVSRHLRKQRILVRHFDVAGLDDRLRISVGDRAAVERRPRSGGRYRDLVRASPSAVAPSNEVGKS